MYTPGQAVKFYSNSHRRWLDTHITEVGQGRVRVACKANWISDTAVYIPPPAEQVVPPAQQVTAPAETAAAADQVAQAPPGGSQDSSAKVDQVLPTPQGAPSALGPEAEEARPAEEQVVGGAERARGTYAPELPTDAEAYIKNLGSVMKVFAKFTADGAEGGVRAEWKRKLLALFPKEPRAGVCFVPFNSHPGNKSIKGSIHPRLHQACDVMVFD